MCPADAAKTPGKPPRLHPAPPQTPIASPSGRLPRRGGDAVLSACAVLHCGTPRTPASGSRVNRMEDRAPQRRGRDATVEREARWRTACPRGHAASPPSPTARAAAAHSSSSMRWSVAEHGWTRHTTVRCAHRRGSRARCGRLPLALRRRSVRPAHGRRHRLTRAVRGDARLADRPVWGEHGRGAADDRCGASPMAAHGGGCDRFGVCVSNVRLRRDDARRRAQELPTLRLDNAGGPAGR